MRRAGSSVSIASQESLGSYAYSIGEKVRCQKREGETYETRDAEIIERRTLKDGSCQYYVHYTDFNRRLDEWVLAERLSRAMGSNAERKRKLDPAVASLPTTNSASHHDEVTAGELDVATQREHEAATRVKNINKIVLGKWEMQTWYFSPFPKIYCECDTLYFCETDLHFTRSRAALERCDYIYTRRAHGLSPAPDAPREPPSRLAPPAARPPAFGPLTRAPSPLAPDRREAADDPPPSGQRDLPLWQPLGLRD